jgi:hypothetical protein
MTGSGVGQLCHPGCPTREIVACILLALVSNIRRSRDCRLMCRNMTIREGAWADD